jgi:hypothetical protein
MNEEFRARLGGWIFGVLVLILGSLLSREVSGGLGQS